MREFKATSLQVSNSFLHWQPVPAGCSLFTHNSVGPAVQLLAAEGSHSDNGEEGPGVHHDKEVERFYTTQAWRKARDAVLKEHGGLCQICMSKGLIEPAVHVHHRIHLTAENINDPHITLDRSNLMALCEACHSEQHRTKRWRCDALGRVTL